MKTRKKVTIERNILPHPLLRKGAEFFLENAQKNIDGQYFNLISCNLFCALSIESCLNFIGGKTIKEWQLIERKLSPKNKVLFISRQIGWGVDFGRRPFQTYDKIFKYRNLMAHPKSEFLSEESIQKLEDGENPRKPYTEWEKMTDVKTAKQFYEDTKKIIRALLTATNIDISDLKSLSYQSTTTVDLPQE